MARLTEVDVDFISLVKKGANKQKINIYKSDDYEPDITHEENEEMKGFFNVMKSFFSKEKEVKKAASPVKGFKDRMIARDVLDNIWSINDTLVSTMRDVISSTDIKDKKEALNTVIDEHGAYLKAKIENINDIKKSDELFNEGDEDLKKEDITEIFKEVIQPLNDRLDKLEKGETNPSNNKNDGDDETKEELTKEDISKAFQEAIQPLSERIERIEEYRGISKQLDDEGQTEVRKSTSVFAGIDI